MKSAPTSSLDTRLSLPSTLERAWNRLLTRLKSRGLRFVYSPTYLVDLGGTPVDVLRAERILAFLLAYGLLPHEWLLNPEMASLWDLRLAHSRRYLEALRQPEALREIVGTDIWPDLHQQALLAQRAAVGGTILATRRALERQETVVNLGGGFHHADRDEGRGFCIFNDVAVAVGRARREGFDGPILVVDLDLHDGNGTRRIFARDPTVFTFSVHNQTWDHDPAEASLSIELGAEVDDARYLEVLDRQLPQLFARGEPQLLFYLAGTDIAADDRIGNWQISAEGILKRDRLVMSHTRRGLSTVVLLAGGYGNETWRYSGRFLAWLLSGRDGIEPPSTTEITLERFRYLTKELRALGAAGGTSRDDDWGLSEQDILGGIGVDARQSLFLDKFSHHAVELTFEWTGILDRLRQMGFANPTLDLDLRRPGGDTVRMFADSRHEELLMELRLRRDRSSIPGMELLALEWLLLQNPRASFSDRSPALPGQKHPGLGLVRDIMSLLILISDQLQLDGIIFVPSQYHLALKGRRFLSFLEAEDEGWFRALEKTLSGCSLAEATGLVAGGAIVDADSGAVVQWRPMKMVLPISDQLHDRVEGRDYVQRAAAFEASLSFEIRTGAALRPTDDLQ